MKKTDMSWDAIILDESDNIATALRPLVVGESVKINHNGQEMNLEICEPIALCHKFAVSPIADGEIIRKYGLEIGRANTTIAVGYHVHVHNLDSIRAKLAYPKPDGAA